MTQRHPIRQLLTAVKREALRQEIWFAWRFYYIAPTAFLLVYWAKII